MLTTKEILNDAVALYYTFYALTECAKNDDSFQDYYTSYCEFTVLYLRDDDDTFTTLHIDSDAEYKRECVMHLVTFLDTLVSEYAYQLRYKDSIEYCKEGKVIADMYYKYRRIVLNCLNI